jgi:hypothetical protein
MESPDTFSMHGVVPIDDGEIFETTAQSILDDNPEKVFLSVVTLRSAYATNVETLITPAWREGSRNGEVLECSQDYTDRTLVAWFHNDNARPATDEKIYELGMTNSDRIMFKMRSNL